jgi:phosphocarrier protein HPr
LSEAVSAKVRIANIRGLHARASARFCALAASFDAAVRVTKDDYTVGGRSIMALMMLGAKRGSWITIAAEGPQAKEALAALARLVRDRFGEKR